MKLRIQYRGKCSEDFARALHKCKAPCTVVMTLRKLKTMLPSLKPPVEKMLKSGLVYRRVLGPTAPKQDLGDGLKIASRIWEMASKKAGYGRWGKLWDAGEEVFVKWET